MNSYYILKEIYGDHSYAGSKARNDIFYFISQHKFKTIDFFLYKRIKLLSIIGIRNIIDKINKFCTLMFLFTIIKRRSILFLQYPFYSFCSIIPIANIYLKFLKKVKKIIYITVLHDINGSRFITTKKKLLDQELKLFKNFNFIIAHNTTMKQFLISKGIKDPHIFILNLFDYKTNFMISMRKKNNTVVFAGNLNKSDFVKKLPALANSVNYNLYGLLDDKNYFKKNKNIIYHGTFSPDIIPQTITGAYGLVWDGDNLDTCNGENGEYLKLNTSHKISLYIVSGLPIIIWSEAAMSKFITKNNLGLSVNSLYDIEKLLSNITEKKYIEMQNSLINFSKLIKNGKNITGVVDKILMEIS